MGDVDEFNNEPVTGGVDINGFIGVCIRFDEESDELKIENGSLFIGSFIGSFSIFVV